MKRLGRVLVLDDDPDVVNAACLALAPDADRVDSLDSPDGIGPALERETYEVVLLDMNFAPGDHSGQAGLNALRRIQAADGDLCVVLMTVYGGVALAVEALKHGAADFVLKPWRNERLIEAAAAAADLTRAHRAGDNLNLDVIERRAIERARARCDGNVSQTAAVLGLTRPALYRRMTKHGL